MLIEFPYFANTFYVVGNFKITNLSTFSDGELFNRALIGSFPTLLLEVVIITIVLYKINLEKTVANNGLARDRQTISE